MRGPLNTLFGRMALLSAAVLLAMQLGWFLLLARQGPHHDVDGFARGVLLALRVASEENAHEASVPPPVHLGESLDPAKAGELSGMLRVHRVPAWNMPRDIHLHEPTRRPLVELIHHLRAQSPPGTQFAVDDARPPQLWVLYPGSASWVVVPVDIPPPPHFVIEAVSMLMVALTLSFLAAWQIQKPLASLAQAARRFGTGERIAPLMGKGPRELREVSASFNDMMRCVNEAEDDRVMMLSGIAHDLKTPLTRLKLRASLMVEEGERKGMLGDIDSLAHIIQQFLEYAQQVPDAGKLTEVDSFLQSHFGNPDEVESGTGPLFVLDLRAGSQFKLPQVVLDRLVTNLVENALDYGAPPVEITTSIDNGSCVIRVRDHGEGIEPDRIAAAMRPFVRLNPARGGVGHCGLGLSIVARLARDNGGECLVENHPDGGLLVQLVFPATRR
ncbi:ATP-binding protein [Paraburkholderia dinghuensis]|uniref:histidine kinase n=1 Tax=Paraburkholderia dinghuensis TaxID=2305225 RepID=A0A3N6MG54_9BURK|nr:ATP-binding protein [Paraburkholderia dinghuensis]RQH02959.1 HAMP domain-containing protein [Paraburkholderia dinghuensis]